MEINSDLIMQYGLMSKLSTGHALLDAILVMLVPLLVNRGLPHIHSWVGRLWESRAPVEHTVERIIEHKQKSAAHWWYSSDEDTPNHKLQQAIIVYLNTLPSLFHKLESCNVQLCKAKRRQEAKEDSDGEGCEGDASSGTSSDSDWYPGAELEEFEVKMVPPLDTWIEVEPGLSFKRAELRETNDKETQVVTVYQLVGESAKQVDEFIDKAYEAYRTMLKGEQSGQKANRYLYLPVLMGSGNSGGDGGSSDHITYRRYKLSDDKSFDNLFHPDKADILRLVGNFSQKQGKFGIKGYPHKLGFLMHGPPGTGKTSFIKALATHTGRSIINIPLSRIKTNQQLMDMMMDQKIKVEDEDMRVPLPFHKVIYVMEDVDAASHVVQKRESAEASKLAASLAALTANRNKTKTTSTAEVSVKASAGTGAGSQKAAASGAAECVTNSNDTEVEKDADVTDSPKAVYGPALPAGGKAAAWLAGGMSGMGGDDALNLAGLLNVLDGVVDTPGRIVIMSTNHPEKLDPALIRPGRINKKVYMGNIAAAEALAMIQHYFGKLSVVQQQQLIGSWVAGVVSPAALEALCAEFEDVEGLLAAVQQLVAVTAGSSSKPTVVQQQQQQRVRSTTTAAASASCEGASARSCVIIRASSCTATFTATATAKATTSSSTAAAAAAASAGAHCGSPFAVFAGPGSRG